MFVRRMLSVLLLLTWGAAFNSICAAAPPVMVEKNLFATDRKPPPPDSAETSANAAKPGIDVGNLQLDGVIMRSNAKRAILRIKNQPAGASGKKGLPTSPFVTVREGQTVSDYRVLKIESKSISLEKDGQTFTISLFAENKVLTPPSPPAPAPAQQPVAAPGAPSQEAVGNQPANVGLQPGLNPQNAQQPIPGQGQAPQPPPGSAMGRFPAVRNPQQNVYAPASGPVTNPDPNQPAEIVEEQE